MSILVEFMAVYYIGDLYIQLEAVANVQRPRKMKALLMSRREICTCTTIEEEKEEKKICHLLYFYAISINHSLYHAKLFLCDSSRVLLTQVERQKILEKQENRKPIRFQIFISASVSVVKEYGNGLAGYAVAGVKCGCRSDITEDYTSIYYINWHL